MSKNEPIELPKGLTDTEIVTMLRSDDIEQRQRALNQVFSDRNRPFGAILIRVGALTCTADSTSMLDVQRAFIAALSVCQNLGAQLGLSLLWMPTGPPKSGLVIPG